MKQIEMTMRCREISFELLMQLQLMNDAPIDAAGGRKTKEKVLGFSQRLAERAAAIGRATGKAIPLVSDIVWIGPFLSTIGHQGVFQSSGSTILLSPVKSILVFKHMLPRHCAEAQIEIHGKRDLGGRAWSRLHSQ